VTEDLTAQLLAAIEETERIASAATKGPWEYHSSQYRVVNGDGLGVVSQRDYALPVLDGDGRHIAHHDPQAVTRRCAADRKIVELHSGAHSCRELSTGTYPADWPPSASYGSPGAEWRHGNDEYFEGSCPTLRLLAEAYGITTEETSTDA
jgi:hypothetical protein